MNKEISKAIEILRWPLMVGVVLIHSSSTNVSLSEGQVIGGDSGYLNLFTQNLFSDVFARIAVPMFFLISGYLLYGKKSLLLD